MILQKSNISCNLIISPCFTYRFLFQAIRQLEISSKKSNNVQKIVLIPSSVSIKGLIQ